MTIPVAKFVRFLDPTQPAELRAAAALLLGELGVKEASVQAAILAALEDGDEAVRLPALRTAGKLKIAKSLPTLIERIKSGGPEASAAAEAAAQLGAEGVRKLQDLLHHVVPGVRKYIVAALTAVTGGGADSGVGVLFDPDPQVALSAAGAIVGRIPSLTPARRAELAAELVAIASQKKTKVPVHSEYPLVKVLASLNDPAAANVLWDRVGPGFPKDVRALALSTVGGWLQKPNAEQWKRLFQCAAEREFQVAAPALVLLSRLPSTDKQTEAWIELLKAPDAAARKLAIERIGDRDHPTVIEVLLEQLNQSDRSLRDLAQAKLAANPAGREALVTALLEGKTSDEMWPLSRLVAPFAAHLSPKLRAAVLAAAVKALESDDHRADPLFFVLREGDANALRDDLFEKAQAKRKKKDYDGALKMLKLLARDPSIGFPVRFELALVGLKLSAKNVAADARQLDLSLRNFSTALAQNAEETQKQIEKSKAFDAEDLFYLGFHFAEQYGPEKAFGIQCLKGLIKSSPKSKLAANAKNKLKSLGVK